MSRRSYWFPSLQEVLHRIMLESSVAASEQDALPKAVRLSNIDASLHELCRSWLRTGELPSDYAVGGYSVARIRELQPHLPNFGVLTFLDGLAKENQRTKTIRLLHTPLIGMAAKGNRGWAAPTVN